MEHLPDPFPQAALPFRVEAAAASDVGRQRTNNEDRVVVVDLSTGVAVGGGSESTSYPRGGEWFAAVCDGMGGEEGGEVASTLTVDALLLAMLELRGRCDVGEAIRASLVRASEIVFAEPSCALIATPTRV